MRLTSNLVDAENALDLSDAFDASALCNLEEVDITGLVCIVFGSSDLSANRGDDGGGINSRSLSGSAMLS